MRPEEVIPYLKENILVDGFEIVLDVEKSRGVWLIDEQTGNEYLDCYIHHSSLPLGHNYPELTTDAFLKKVGRITVEKPANSDIYTSDYGLFVKALREYAIPLTFKYLFFVSDGALAVENAIKTAFDWKHRKNHKKYARTSSVNKLRVISFNQAFHGRTLGALSVTKTADTHIMNYPRYRWFFAPAPFLHPPVNEQELERVEKSEQQTINYIKGRLACNRDKIAAIIIEPIQGVGGDNHFRPEFLRQLRDITLNEDILLIFDEVQTGAGTAGSMWCFEQFEILPDIFAFGKKTHICGIAATRRIDEVEDHVFAKSGRINSTWGGHAGDMVVCAKTLEIIREKKILENIKTVGNYFNLELEELANEDNRISGVRGRGFFGPAFDLPDEKNRDRFHDLLLEERLLQLKCGVRSIRLRPPLIFEKEHVDIAMKKIRAALRKL